LVKKFEEVAEAVTERTLRVEPAGPAGDLWHFMIRGPWNILRPGRRQCSRTERVGRPKIDENAAHSLRGVSDEEGHNRVKIPDYSLWITPLLAP